MAKYDKKVALKIMIEAAKQYEEKLNDKHFLIVYQEGKDTKTVKENRFSCYLVQGGC